MKLSQFNALDKLEGDVFLDTFKKVVIFTKKALNVLKGWGQIVPSLLINSYYLERTAKDKFYLDCSV